MPYYVFAVRPFSQLDKLAEFEAFAPASAHAKALRATQASDDRARIRVIFAADTIAAEDLLLQVRDAPAGADE